jgi:dienelactone hydrolase/Zn-dependent protease
MSESAAREPEDEQNFIDEDVVLEPDDAPEPSADGHAEDDPWTQEVFRQLDLLQNKRRSWVQSLIILVVTAVLFGAAQFVRKSAENLAWLVGVLLIHESGHFAGMKMFGYRDVRMFFLPFFGAAVSGRAHNVPGWQAAIVILLGPVPGIAIGVVLGIVALAFKMDSLHSTAMLFAALNGFNLLPFMPLDGGRLLQLVLFGRQRHLEALFQATTGLLLALLGFVGGGWFLGLVGVMMLIGSGHVFRISTVARQTLAELGHGWKAPDDFEHIPDGVARQILQGVRIKFPHNKNAKMAASLIRQVWDRMQINPPGLIATLALLCVYAFSLISALIIVVALAVVGMKNGRFGPGLSPEPPLQGQDYAEARQTFRTSLLRHGPSPQRVDEVARVPEGVQKISYTSGSLELAAFVDGPPPDESKRPAVLFLHGGFAFGGDDLEMPQPFRDAGFIVMVPVLRGENGQPGSYTLFYDEVHDVLAAAEALAQRPGVDANRMFISGHSAGGTLTMLAAMSSRRFRAAAPLSGSCSQFGQNPAWIPFDTSNVREFEMRSPVSYATSFKCPVRIFYGDQEAWAVSVSAATAKRATQAGLDVAVVTVPGNHSTSVPESIRRAIEFFNGFPAGETPGKEP